MKCQRSTLEKNCFVDSVLELIGNTPLMRLQRLSGTSEVFAKLEFFNPGGSIKDRAALFMIEGAEKDGLLKPGGTIIEVTAGNTGIGLALVASRKGYRTVFVVPERFSVEKQSLMKALGAEVVLTPGEIGIEGAIEKARELSRTIPGVFFAQQFANQDNVTAHYQTTAREIYEQMDGVIDFFVCGVGTGGTFTGATRYLKEKLPHMIAVAVEPQGSILGGGPAGKHKTEGIGVDNLDTVKALDRSLIDRVITVQDRDAQDTMKFLALYEGILAGSSSGAAAYAAGIIAEENPGARIVTIFPDGSDRYLSKNVYGDFNEWKY